MLIVGEVENRDLKGGFERRIWSAGVVVLTEGVAGSAEHGPLPNQV